MSEKMDNSVYELAYHLTKEDRHKPCEITNYSNCMKVREVYGIFDETHRRKFDKCCFRNLLEISDRNSSNQIINQLMIRQTKCVNKNEVWFVIGKDKRIRFGIEELVLVTGFNAGEDNFDKSLGKESRLVKKYFKDVDELNRIELWDAFESCKGSEEDKYKLGLLVILAFVVAAVKDKSIVPFWWFELVDKLEAFEEYPWAEVCLKQTMKTFRQDLTNPLLSPNVKYPIFGFSHAIVVWALESIPSLKTFGEIIDEDVDVFPRMLKWNLQKRLLGVRVDQVLEVEQIMVISKLQPTTLESQQPYWGSIVCRKQKVIELLENEKCNGVDYEMEIKHEGAHGFAYEKEIKPEGAHGFDYEKMKKIVTSVVKKENEGIYSMMDRLKKEIQCFRRCESCKKVNHEEIIDEEMKVDDRDMTINDGEGEVGREGRNDEKDKDVGSVGKNDEKEKVVGCVQKNDEKEKVVGGSGKRSLIEEGTSSLKRSKLLSVESYDPYRDVEKTKCDGLKKWLSDYKEGKAGELVKLCDGTARCELLKTILDGGSLSSPIMNTCMHEIRRRALKFPKLFEQDSCVLDVFFQHFMKVKNEELQRRVHIENLANRRILKNYVEGKHPEDSKPWSECNYLYAPMLVSDHWFAVKVDLKEGVIYVADSLPKHVRKDQFDKCMLPLQVVIPWMLNMDGEDEGGRNRRFKVVKMVKLPKQSNGTDCGMYTIKFIEFMMAKLNVQTMDAGFMPYWRPKLVAELLACQFDP